MWLSNKELACQWKRDTGNASLTPGWEDTLEKEVPAHFSILAWIIPWIEELDRPQCMGSQKVGRDWVTNAYTQQSSEVGSHCQCLSYLPTQTSWRHVFIKENQMTFQREKDSEMSKLTSVYCNTYVIFGTLKKIKKNLSLCVFTLIVISGALHFFV